MASEESELIEIFKERAIETYGLDSYHLTEISMKKTLMRGKFESDDGEVTVKYDIDKLLPELYRRLDEQGEIDSDILPYEVFEEYFEARIPVDEMMEMIERQEEVGVDY